MTFKNRRRYEYYDVPFEVFAGWKDAASAGRCHHRWVKRYRYRRVFRIGIEGSWGSGKSTVVSLRVIKVACSSVSYPGTLQLVALSMAILVRRASRQGMLSCAFNVCIVRLRQMSKIVAALVAI